MTSHLPGGNCKPFATGPIRSVYKTPDYRINLDYNTMIFTLFDYVVPTNVYVSALPEVSITDWVKYDPI